MTSPMSAAGAYAKLARLADPRPFRRRSGFDKSCRLTIVPPDQRENSYLANRTTRLSSGHHVFDQDGMRHDVSSASPSDDVGEGAFLNPEGLPALVRRTPRSNFLDAL